MINVILIILIATSLSFAVRYLVKLRKHGGACAGCSGCSSATKSSGCPACKIAETLDEATQKDSGSQPPNP